ncbi:MAG TPA: hypothetical protein VGN34_17750 [Ktedonobacteraceae bacterium]
MPDVVYEALLMSGMQRKKDTVTRGGVAAKPGAVPSDTAEKEDKGAMVHDR